MRDEWVIDSAPDKKNAEFKSLYRGDVPLYRRSTDRCLGLYPKKKRSGGGGGGAPVLLQWDDGRSRGRGRFFDAPRPSSRYYAATAMKVLGPGFTPQRIIVPKPEPKPKGRRWDSAKPTKAAPAAAFMSLSTPEIPEEGDTALPGQSHEERTLELTADFNRKLHAAPRDVDRWLAFIRFQDKALFPLGTRRIESVATEKKLAIYERALRSNPKSEALIAAYLDTCRLKLDLAVVEEKWKKTMFSHPASVPLWRSFLAFFTSELSQYRFPKAQGHYHKAIETMAAIRGGAFGSHQMDQESAERALVDMVTESIHFQRRAGFGERALGCFQAVLECTVFLPPELLQGGQRAKLISMLELFWAADVPRFGDKNAAGFAKWHELRRMGGQAFQQPVDYPNGPEDPVEDLSALPPWQRWLQLESWREKAHWRPWRPQPALGLTEEDCDDPDRMVVFDDVAGHLVQIQSESLRFELLYRFFDFNGVAMRPRHSSGHRYTLEQFVGLEEAGQLFAPLAHLMSTERRRHQPSPAELDRLGLPAEPVRRGPGDDPSYPFGIEAGRDPRVWGVGEDVNATRLRRPRSAWTRPTPGDDATKRRFVSNAFEQALLYCPGDDYLRLNLIDFLAERDLKAARKRCKKMLKEQAGRNNLLLLDRYATLELAAGSVIDAKKLYETAVAMAKSLSAEERSRGHATLCRHYAEVCLDQGDNHSAVRALATFVLEEGDIPGLGRSGEAVPPTMVAKARKAFSTRAPGLDPKAVDEVACHALFELATVGMDRAAAFYEATIKTCPRPTDPDGADTWAHEQLLEDHVHMLHWHSRREPTPPSVLRAAVARALAAFPSNPGLLTVFIASEARCRIAARVRKHFDAVLQEAAGANSPVLFMFAVYGELSQQHGASVHRARALFGRAAADPTARRCPLLWRMALEFERAQPVAGAAEAAQAVLYRALQNCPGAKCLYLDGTSRLPSMLQEVLDIMQEKELHLRSPLEELELIAEEEEEEKERQKRADRDALEMADERQELEAQAVELLLAEEGAMRDAEIQRFLAGQLAGE